MVKGARMVKAERGLRAVANERFCHFSKAGCPNSYRVVSRSGLLVPGRSSTGRIKYYLGPNSEKPEIIIPLANPEAALFEAQLKRKTRLFLLEFIREAETVLG